MKNQESQINEKVITTTNLNELLNISNKGKTSLIENQYKVSPLDLATEARYNKFLDLLRSQSPIGMWKLRNISTNSYGFIKQAIRHFEFCHLIKTQIVMNNQGRKEKIIYVPFQKNHNQKISSTGGQSPSFDLIRNNEVVLE